MLYLPVLVGQRSYSSLTEGISEDVDFEELLHRKHQTIAKTQHPLRDASNPLQNLKTKNKKNQREMPPNVVLPIHKKDHKILLVSQSFHGLLQ